MGMIAALDHAERELGDAALIQAIQDGLPLVERPFAIIGERLGVAEQAVIERIELLLAAGAIKRFGVVVRHHELGYRANAMVVWDIPDARVDQLGDCIGRMPFVTLCYRRPRRPPEWPYNLFSMIHGRDRESVLERVQQIKQNLGLHRVQAAVLFSGRRYKQRGARYDSASTVAEKVQAGLAEALADTSPPLPPLPQGAPPRTPVS